MDFSQLPKMSKTPTPPEDPDITDPSPQRPAYAAVDYGRAPASALVSIWVSLIVGLICLMLGWNFARFSLAKLAGKPFETGVNWVVGPNAGQPVSYFELQGGTAWTDAGFFSMGVALLLDAVLIFVASRQLSPNRALVLAALTVTGLTLLLNVGIAGYVLTIGLMPLASMILVLVGGFVLFDQVPMVKRVSSP